MASILSLTPTVRVFPCPACGQTINVSFESCPFCHTSIDSVVAEGLASFTSKISKACNDASYLKIVLGALIPFAVFIFIPFFGAVGLFGSVFVKYLLIVLAIRWWIQYGRLRTADADYRSARKSTIIVSCISILILFCFHIRFGNFSF